MAGSLRSSLHRPVTTDGGWTPRCPPRPLPVRRRGHRAAQCAAGLAGRRASVLASASDLMTMRNGDAGTRSGLPAGAGRGGRWVTRREGPLTGTGLRATRSAGGGRIVRTAKPPRAAHFKTPNVLTFVRVPLVSIYYKRVFLTSCSWRGGADFRSCGFRSFRPPAPPRSPAADVEQKNPAPRRAAGTHLFQLLQRRLVY